MSAPSLYQGRPVHLFTHWGTVVYFDPATRELRHAVVQERAVNAVLVACGLAGAESAAAILTFWDVDESGAIICEATASRAAPCADMGTVLQFSIIDQDTITLRADGLFLCAEPDGRVTLSRPSPGGWERFTIDALAPAECARVDASSREIREAVSRARDRFSLESEPFLFRSGRFGTAAVVCDISWLQGYIVNENYHFVRLLTEHFDVDVIDSEKTDFSCDYTTEIINSYEAILIAYQRETRIPVNRYSSYTILKIDDLESYNDTYTELLKFFSRHSDMLIGPYAYEIPRYFPHRKVVWVPYSSAIEEEGGLLPFNANPTCKVLVSGSVAWDRPFRTYVFELEDDRLAKLGHPGYGNKYDGSSNDIVKDKWFRELNQYLAAFCDAHSLRYIHIRAFEIASVGALLLADRLVEPEMNQLGFVDGETCVFCDVGDFLEKVSWVLDEANRERVDEIRLAGMRLTLEKHTTRRRVADFVAMLNATLGLDIQRRPHRVA